MGVHVHPTAVYRVAFRNFVYIIAPLFFFFWFPEERGGESGGGKERAGLTFGTPLLQTLLLCCGFGLYKLAMKWSFSGQKSLPL